MCTHSGMHCTFKQMYTQVHGLHMREQLHMDVHTHTYTCMSFLSTFSHVHNMLNPDLKKKTILQVL